MNRVVSRGSLLIAAAVLAACAAKREEPEQDLVGVEERSTTMAQDAAKPTTEAARRRQDAPAAVAAPAPSEVLVSGNAAGATMPQVRMESKVASYSIAPAPPMPYQQDVDT